MFGISKDGEEKLSEKDSISVGLKYEKPKILLMDLPKDVFTGLENAGYNIFEGTFGSPYKVEPSNQFCKVIGTPEWPNIAEQEIIFIDLTLPMLLDDPRGQKRIPDEENDIWASCKYGTIDPRPRNMFAIHEQFDRILKHGGIFIIFAQPRLLQDLVVGKSGFSQLQITQKLNFDNWSFLSILSPDNLQIEDDDGEEITMNGNPHQMFNFLRQNIKNAKYYAKFRPQYSLKDYWVPLLKNKYNEDVAGMIISDKLKGVILILPQIIKTPKAILSILTEVLPEISPELFPEFEGGEWVEREEYELDSVKKFEDEKRKVQAKAENDLISIDKKIERERENLGFLHGILTKTGDELVEDVKKCLDFIEFQRIIDVDNEIGDTKPKQEDLQILDRSPSLLLEIKGISGLPNEEKVLQVVKYIPRRMREWGRTEVRGVSLINHQKHIPALERDNKNVFTKQQIEDADSHDITLLTTWDLFRLTRGMIKYGWNPETIKAIFYDKGRISEVPNNYKPIGTIFTHITEKNVMGIKITDRKMFLGQRIGYNLPNGFLEEDVTSLQVDSKDVQEAQVGESVGIITNYSKIELKTGIMVYEVI